MKVFLYCLAGHYNAAISTLHSVKEILGEIKPELASKFHVSSIGLFGSILRKDFSAFSDIDIIVDFDGSIGVEFIDLAAFLESRLSREVDIVSKNGIRPKYFKVIEPEIIYV